MSTPCTSADLPESLLEEISKTAGVAVSRETKNFTTYNISNSSGAMSLYKMYLLNNSVFLDPFLRPMFGGPHYSFIPPLIQREVYNLLLTFQPLVQANFVPGAGIPPFIQAALSVPAGVRYHHCKIAIQAVQEELQTVNLFAAQCPGLAQLASGQIICDLEIRYKHTIIIIRIRKW